MDENTKDGDPTRDLETTEATVEDGIQLRRALQEGDLDGE